MSTREKEEEEEGEKKISNEGRDNGEEDESIFTAATRISGNGNKIPHRMRDKSI